MNAPHDDTITAAVDAWRERAAIMQHDGGLSRDEAERAATDRIALEFGRDVAVLACEVTT